ncbi:porin [Paraburkholderia sp. JPY419]|uniref:porin n=1 Tax=Paraburkholderia sp. JPY419 TaxID=667660 RepID=UPI003D1FB5F8
MKLPFGSFWLESGFDSANGEFRSGGDLFGRQAWVGLTPDGYGSITLGRQCDFIVDYVAGALHGHGIKFDDFEVNGPYFELPDDRLPPDALSTL